MSNTIKDNRCLFSKLLNHSIILEVSFHWFTFVISCINWLIFSRITLPILPILDFERFIKQHEILFGITIKANLHIVNFLDITLDLCNNTYELYRKPDNHPVCINENSNHPKTILRELSKSISERLSDLSSNKEIFQKATSRYFEALKKSGFNKPLVFIPKTNTSDNISKKQRKRKIIWFNPPFSLSVKTNIGRTFLKLLKQHFPKSNRLHKIFNKNTVKVSYSCMSNLSSIISSHNKRLLRPRIT